MEAKEMEDYERFKKIPYDHLNEKGEEYLMELEEKYCQELIGEVFKLDNLGLNKERVINSAYWEFHIKDRVIADAFLKDQMGLVYKYTNAPGKWIFEFGMLKMTAEGMINFCQWILDNCTEW